MNAYQVKKEIFLNLDTCQKQYGWCQKKYLYFRNISWCMLKVNFANSIAHIVGCLIFLSSPLLFLTNRGGSSNIFSILFSTGYVIFSITFLFVFYFNTYVLVPFLYLRKSFALYFFIIALMLLIVYIIRPFDGLISPPSLDKPSYTATQSPDRPGIGQARPQFHPEDIQAEKSPRLVDPISVFLFVMAVVMGLAIRTTSQLMTTEQRIANAEADKANAELSFLKAQINPHFLFNSLNSIYALAIRKDDRTADAVVQLSELMRYIIRDANSDMVELEKETSYISNYIELQKSRLGDTVIISHQLKGNTGGLKIAPLILTSFVENAFKHGVNPDKNSKIEVLIAIIENNLRLYVFNRKTSAGKLGQGIGLENSKKRLEMVYPAKHELVIHDTEDSYTVHLLINLQ